MKPTWPKAPVKEGAGDGASPSPTSVVEIPKALQSAFRPGGQLGVAFGSPEGLVLLRDGMKLSGFFAASLSSISLPEVFATVLAGVRTGRLVVQSHGMRKTVSFRDGQITFATSSEPHERLGALLVRLKLVSAEDLKHALVDVKPGTKLGQVLTRKKLLSASSLYSAMTFLTREIVLDLFGISEGEFLFLEGVEPGEDALKLPDRTRDLVIDGIKRGEEVSRLRKRFHPGYAVETAERAGAADEALPMLERAEHGSTVGELRPLFVGNDYGFFSLLDELVRTGTLRSMGGTNPQGQTRPGPSEKSTLQHYENLIGSICDAFIAAGLDLKSLNTFFEDPLPGLSDAVAGVSLSEDGTLDLARVEANCRQDDPVVGRAKTYEALDAFISYALFAAKNEMPPELAQGLADEYRKLQEGIG